jgi:hypothetical protein
MMEMKIAVYIAVAIVLGVVVMLAPLLVFTVYGYHSVITQIENEQGLPDLKGYGFNRTELITLGGYDNNSIQVSTIGEAARIYGMLDFRAEPFPSSLFPSVLLVIIGFVTALGVTLLYKRRV